MILIQFKYEDKLLVRNSQEVMFDSFKMSLNLPGFTGLSVGDICSVEIPLYEQVNKGDLDIDPYLSGRYLVSKITHKINPRETYNSMIVEVIKDSVKRPYYYRHRSRTSITQRGKRQGLR